MDEWITDCVFMLEYMTENIKYKEWKERAKKSLCFNKKRFAHIIMFLLTHEVIDCVNGRFRYNERYVEVYISMYKRAPDFCMEHMRYFHKYVHMLNKDYERPRPEKPITHIRKYMG